jgi:hypothetical protein
MSVSIGEKAIAASRQPATDASDMPQMANSDGGPAAPARTISHEVADNSTGNWMR